MTRPLHRLRLAAALTGLCCAFVAPAGATTAKKTPPAKPGTRVASSAAAASAPAAPTPYARRDDVAQFADLVAGRNGLDADWVRSTLAAARYQPGVARLVMPPPAGMPKNWAVYRTRFVEPKRIAAGAEFWRANALWLERAERTYGVPPEIVVGIVGVETIYGQQMGGFRAVDALATLAFDFPAGRKDRSAFFRDELEQLFVLCRGPLPRSGAAALEAASAASDAVRTGEPAPNEPCDPLALRSSYAGALGMPQFMPSSVNRYAVDFDADGRIDLRQSAADTIGSVARYLAAFGWQRGMATHYEVAVPVDASQRATLLVPDIVPSFTAGEFTELGAALGSAGRDHDGLLALVELQNGDAAPSYLAGTANFYAITRYNWSSYYALAVIELGKAVKRQVEAPAARP